MTELYVADEPPVRHWGGWNRLRRPSLALLTIGVEPLPQAS